MRASGTTTVSYGGMRENVKASEVVLADGQVIQTGNRARKYLLPAMISRRFWWDPKARWG